MGTLRTRYAVGNGAGGLTTCQNLVNTVRATALLRHTGPLIESDLTEAVNSGTLPSKTNADDQETGIRITRETAQAFLARAYLFPGQER